MTEQHVEIDLSETQHGNMQRLFEIVVRGLAAQGWWPAARVSEQD